MSWNDRVTFDLGSRADGQIVSALLNLLLCTLLKKLVLCKNSEKNQKSYTCIFLNFQIFSFCYLAFHLYGACGLISEKDFSNSVQSHICVPTVLNAYEIKCTVKVNGTAVAENYHF
jgi:hypothetical protein